MDPEDEYVRTVLAVQQLFAQQDEDDAVEDEEEMEQDEAEEAEQRALQAQDEDSEEDTLEAASARLRRRRRCELVGILNLTQNPSDGRTVEEKARDHVRSSNFRQQLKMLAPHLPTIGRGNSAANDEASRKRRDLVYPAQDGIYQALCSIPEVNGIDAFRQTTGFSREEFDEFYAEQGGDRGHLFKQPRNHLGDYTEDENKERRRVKGLLSDRDRVICWLEMLRKDKIFVDMEAKYGPSRGTFHNDFKWMTMAAADMQILHDVSQHDTALSGIVVAVLSRSWNKKNTYISGRRGCACICMSDSSCVYSSPILLLCCFVVVVLFRISEGTAVVANPASGLKKKYVSSYALYLLRGLRI